MGALTSYHGNPYIKRKYVSRMSNHIKADELVRGVGWESNGVTRGCAVGCTLNAYDHAAFETELGIPEWAARLLDHLHENTSEDYLYKGDKLALAFLKAIKPGSDLSRVDHQIHIFIQQENRKQVDGLDIDADLKSQVIAAIDGSIGVRQQALDFGWNESAAAAARSAAEAAAAAVWSAAESAAAAVWSAESAWSAAAANDAIADKFIALLEAA